MESTLFKPYTVLVLDDNPVDIEIVGRLLQTLKHPPRSIYSADNGVEAEQLLKQHSPSIVFIDYQLGSESGVELISSWHERYPNSSYVLMTSRGAEHIVADALRAGASDYIRKENLNCAELETCIDRLIEHLWHREQFQSIMDASEAGILTFDDLGTVLLVNQSIHRLFQRPGDNVGFSISELFSIEESPEVDILDLLIQFAEISQAQTLPLWGIRGNQSRFPVELALSSNIVLGSKVYIAIIQDVTKKKALEALRDQQAAAIQASTDMVAFTNPELKIQYLNKHGAKMSGIEPIFSESNIDIASLLSEDSKKALSEELLPYLQRCSQWNGELELYNPVIQETTPVSVSITAIKSHSGPITSYAFIMRDISEPTFSQKAVKLVSK